MKKIISRIAALAMIVSMAGCSAPAKSEAGIYTPGTYTAEGAGMGPISVEVTVDANKITDVKLNLDQETPSIGQAAAETLISAIIEKQSAEIDGVSGATVTSDAVKAAVAKAIAQAKGEEAETAEVKMAPGTYEAVGTGFSYVEKVPVTVTVDETSITDITVSEECSETTIMLRSAVNKVVPAIIEHQSVKVDAATGATLSSNAIKEAVEDCVKQALAAAGTDEAAIAAFQNVPAKANEGVTKELTADVVVVGLGGAGMAALASCADQGLKVVGIEKADKIGGTTTVASAPMFVNPKQYQDENNNGEDLVDVEDLKQAWLNYTTGADGVQDAKVENVEMLINESGETHDWMVSHGFTFGEPHGGMTPADYWVMVWDYVTRKMVPNDRRIGVQKMYDDLCAEVVAKGNEVYTGTEGYELIMKDGKAAGVKAKGNDGTEYTVMADAVVLCTGGFAGSTEMVDKYITQNEFYDFSNKGGWRVYGCYQNDGKMIASAIENGAGTYNIDMPPMVHNTATPKIMTSMPVEPAAEGTEPITGRPATTSLNDVPQIMSDSANILAVGNNGKRFVNEAMMGVLGSWGNGNQFYSIWSTTQIDDVKENGFTDAKVSRYLGQGGIPVGTPVPEIYEAIDKAIELGIAYKADTLAELADMIGVPADALQETVETYNQYCEAGEDKEFGKAPEMLVKIGEGPYYCFVGAPWCYATCGGLDVNEQCAVLDTKGNVIEGLYACGEDSLGTLMTNEKAYVTFGGGAQGWAVTSGYVVGKVLGEKLGK